jgi:hypothetical protein
MIRMRVSVRASLLRRGPAQAGRRGPETTAPVASSSLAASPLNAAKSHPRSWRGHRAEDIFVLATVLAERSFIVGADSSSKCHNFLSMSPGAESLPLIITLLLRCHHERGGVTAAAPAAGASGFCAARSPAATAGTDLLVLSDDAWNRDSARRAGTGARPGRGAPAGLATGRPRRDHRWHRRCPLHPPLHHHRRRRGCGRAPCERRPGPCVPGPAGRRCRR